MSGDESDYSSWAGLGEECRRMRLASGEVDDVDPLVDFLYLLARDEFPVGMIDELVDKVQENRGRVSKFTNGWLASWAQDARDRLRPPDQREEGEMITLHSSVDGDCVANINLQLGEAVEIRVAGDGGFGCSRVEVECVEVAGRGRKLNVRGFNLANDEATDETPTGAAEERP